MRSSINFDSFIILPYNLPADRKAPGKNGRQALRDDLCLCFLVRIGNAVKGEGSLVFIVYPERRGGVAVARLAYGTGID
jgi:hypothetical protein